MSIHEILQQFDLIDSAILHHGFTPYMRDYALITESYGNEGLSAANRFLFKGCVEAICTLVIKPTAYSMDDRLLSLHDYEGADGFVWGVNYANVEAWEYLDDSPRAQYWANHFGLPMHEYWLRTNVYSLTLIFHGLSVTPAGGEQKP